MIKMLLSALYNSAPLSHHLHRQAVLLHLLLTMVFLSANTQAASLLDSYKKAHAYDAQLKSYQAGLKVHNETVRQSLSPLLPKVGAQYSIVHQDNSSELDLSQRFFGIPLRFPNNKLENEVDQNLTQVRVSQPLFDLERWHDYKSGQNVGVGARAEYIYQRYALIVRVAQAYFDVAKARTNFENNLTEEEAIKSELRRVTLYYNEGLASITDLSEAEAAYDLTQARTLQSSNNYVVSQETLGALTGEQDPQVWQLSPRYPLITLKPSNKEQWVDIGLRYNWAIRASAYAIAAAKDHAKAKSRKFLPKVSGAFTYSNIDTTEKNNIDSEIDTNATQRAASLDINMPLYVGGAISSEKRQAIAELERRQYDHTQLQRDISKNINRLFLTLQALQSQIKAQQRAIKSAEIALKTTKFGYSNGTRNLTDVLHAQSTLFDAKRNYENTRYDYLIYYLQLKHNAGVISAQDIVNINKWLLPNSFTAR